MDSSEVQMKLELSPTVNPPDVDSRCMFQRALPNQIHPMRPETYYISCIGERFIVLDTLEGEGRLFLVLDRATKV
jgi:hypothetical protein